MISPARRAAFRVLLAVARGERDLASALADERRTLTDTRDIALSVELATGTLRWQAALDAAIEPLLARPAAVLDIEVRLALRLGAYQRLFLTRVPARAAVNEAVSLVRDAGRASATGLVNAVLRRLDPDRARDGWPARPVLPCPHGVDAAPDPGSVSNVADSLQRTENPVQREALDYLAITLSHPRWLVARWLDRYGFDAVERWAQFDNVPAPMTLRPLPGRLATVALVERLAAVGVTTRPGTYARDALVVEQGHPLQTDLAHQGLFLVQEEASQLIAQLVVDLAPSFVLDTCAAPGGKTIVIRGGLGNAGRVVACDVRPRRVRLLQAALLQAGMTDVAVVRADFLAPAPFASVFDLVFVDAPCSGLGTIRREPDIRWRRGPDALAPLADLQTRILSHAAACVGPGGLVVYATCSSEPEENEQVVERFLRSTPAFQRLELARHPWTSSPLAGLLTDQGDLRTFPFRHQLEAFYAAVLQHGDDRAAESARAA